MIKKQKIDIKNIDLETVILWLIANQDDSVAMDRVNYLSYSFTSKFKNRYKFYQKNDIDNGVSIG